MLKTMFKMFKTSTKGFSLVELMVVVVIIGVLVSIAIPVYNTTTERAEEGACFANQRMIEGAASQYAMNTGTKLEDVDDIDVLADYFQGGVPKCPSGGTYTLTDGKVSCSEHDHYTASGTTETSASE